MYKPTSEQIKEWKSKYGEGNIYLLQFEDKACVVRKPTRTELAYATPVGQDNPIKFAEIILKSTWLDGDESIKEDDTYFFGVTEKLAEIIKAKSCELVNL